VVAAGGMGLVEAGPAAIRWGRGDGTVAAVGTGDVGEPCRDAALAAVVVGEKSPSERGGGG
jgi:hypothetical protein